MAYLILALVTVGLLLLGLETFMPGFGIAGIMGLVLQLAGVVLAGTCFGIKAALLLLAVVIIVAGVCVMASVRSAKSGRISRSALVLNDTEHGDESSEAVLALVGREGTVVAALRPVGMADFEGDRAQVTAQGEFIPTGTRIKVIKVEGNKVFVKAADA